MFNVTIGKRTYSHPSKLSEVTLKQWIDITSEEDDIDAFSAFSGIPVKELRAAPRKDVEKHMISLAVVLNDSIIDESGEAIKRPVPKKFRAGKYSYIVDQDLDNASMGKYLDCTHYMKLFQGQDQQFYPYMMAIYCQRKGESYDDVDLELRVEEMRKAKATDAMAINAFFLNISVQYSKDYQAYFQMIPNQTS